MTDMKTRDIFALPDQNDTASIERHQRAVFREFNTVFADIDLALRESLPKALDIFGLYQGAVDLSVHAPNVRYLVKQNLASKSRLSVDEDLVHFEMQQVSNCGLCVHANSAKIRVLKAPEEGLPKALSYARVTFSCSNQMVFSFLERETLPPIPLSLYALWTMNSEHKYQGLQIACPRVTRKNGIIECYWIVDWKNTGSLRLVHSQTSQSSDLDGITALPTEQEDQSR